MKREDDLVVVDEFQSSLTAHSLRILLEANGVAAIVDGDHAIDGTERPRLYVKRSDLELAKTVIKEVPVAAEVLFPAWVCECGAEVDEGFQICWSCGMASQSELED